jgi:hypothetical protein
MSVVVGLKVIGYNARLYVVLTNVNQVMTQMSMANVSIVIVVAHLPILLAHFRYVSSL